MTQRSTKPRLTAEAAYENGHLIAQDLVARIKEMLFDLPAPANEDAPIDWRHVGTINEMNSRLSAVVAFLDGTER